MRQTIKIHVKTFFGLRKNLSFLVDIFSTIEALKNLVIESCPESKRTICNLRLFYIMVAYLFT